MDERPVPSKCVLFSYGVSSLFFGSDAFRVLCCFRLELMCEAVPFPPSSEAKSEKRRREDESRDQTVNVKKMRSAIRCDHPRSSFAENSRFLPSLGAVCIASPCEGEKLQRESALPVSFRSKTEPRVPRRVSRASAKAKAFPTPQSRLCTRIL